MRLELWVEGPGDAAPSKGGEAPKGALPTLIRRLIVEASEPSDPRWQISDDDVIIRNLGKHIKEKARSFQRHIADERDTWTRKLLAVMTQSDADNLLIVAAWDRDRREETQRYARDAAHVLEEQGWHRLHVLLSIQEVEALLLSDVDAFQDAFGRVPSNLPRNPEAVSDPKKALGDALAECREARNRETYADLARYLSLERVEKACPNSFAPFATRLRQSIGEIDTAFA